MAIKGWIIFVAMPLMGMALLFSCDKDTEPACAREGVMYNYVNRNTTYAPNVDSIPLGESVTLDVSAPTRFEDVNTNSNVSLDATNIQGPLIVLKASPNSSTPTTGAISDFDLIPLIGSVYKDSIHASEGQLTRFRTTIWERISVDSFKLRLKLKPKIRGTFFINLSTQGNQDSECGTYLIDFPIASEQHLYLLLQAAGNISPYERDYVYCFKVF
jgi:hypothetical protein